MGILSRMSTVVKAKMNRIVDNAENPAENLDLAYEKQREMLRNVKRGVVEMVTAKRRLQLQAGKVKENITLVENQARQAMAAGREDLARQALQRKQTAVLELDGLDSQIASMELEQEKLTNAEQRLQAKVEAFKNKKEVIKAQYSAAQAQVRIGGALSGLSEEMGDISLAVERAETKTETLKAKAGAIDELAEMGMLDDFSGHGDSLGKELAAISASQNVEDELASLRVALPSGQKKALPGGGE
jgi:phage shock protein A